VIGLADSCSSPGSIQTDDEHCSDEGKGRGLRKDEIGRLFLLAENLRNLREGEEPGQADQRERGDTNRAKVDMPIAPFNVKDQPDS
jgi:hypothetical protein